MRLASALLLISGLLSLARPATAQIIGGNGATPGVYVEPDGTVKRRELDARAELADLRARAKLAADAQKDPKIGFVSLPKLVAEAQKSVDAHQPIADEVKYLAGLTRIDYVLVYPEEHDLVLAGPTEPFKVVSGQPTLGAKSGRPVMRLEDLAVAMRVVGEARGRAFGCRLDPDSGAPARISAVMARLARSSRAERLKAVQQATGPQKVSFFGPVPADTRFALTTLAADYELKRFGLGLARHTVSDLGTIVDASRQAVNMIWFELNYEPLLVSADGQSFGLRGQRLKVLAGSFDWDPKGATPKAYEFAKKMTQRMPQLAAQQPLLADLQNLADLSVVAALIRKDQLDQKAGWNSTWLTTDGSGGFPVDRTTTPTQAVALVNYTNGAIACGGVSLAPKQVVEQRVGGDSELQLVRNQRR